MKKHPPYNLLLMLTVLAVGLLAVYNLAFGQSPFEVTLRYQIPKPPEEEASQLPPSPPVEEEEPPPPEEAAQPRQSEEEAVVLARFPLELNEATYDQLLYIPKVGNVTAQRIVQYREHLGGYSRMAQLLEIKGIGAATYEHITAYLYLEEAPEEQDIEDGQDEYNNIDDSIN